ncbi:MAG: hypothetical protein KatS3mg102_3014 [Planctomycetota bacterium]|nr:MAG: hypothetical protein KatS3mg102_3014 [Planctomycetota bacterium]
MNAAWQWLSQPGFAGTRAPLAADLVVAGLLLVVPAFWVGRALAARGRRRAHALLMAAGYGALLGAVAVFIAWVQAGGAPRAARLEAASWYRTGYLPLLAAHVALALGALGSGLAALGLAALGARRHAGGAPRFARAGTAAWHRRLGRAFLVLVTATALSGGAIYWLRYVY